MHATLPSLRPDLAIIAANVPEGARVLDVGCGDGALMAALRDKKRVDARGIELDRVNVAEAVAKGLSVIQGDADRSEEHTSELQSLMRSSYAVFCLKKNNTIQQIPHAILLPYT